MNAIFTHKSDSPVFLIFLYSIIAHIIIFSSVVFFLQKSVKNAEKQNVVYMQITAAPQSVAAPKKEIQKPKELPKKPVIKKLVQQQPLSTKPAPLVQQQPEEKPQTNPNPTTQSSANADANDVATKPVVEAVVDKAARCKTPEIALTQDAANAGVTSGKVILEVQISADGKVTEAKILKGTGFQIDDAVVALAKKMDCIPAEKDGKSVAVIKRMQWLIQR